MRVDQEREATDGDLQDRDSADPAHGDLMQAGSADEEPRIENSLGDYHHQR
jgi:hypothetical protein